MEKLFKFLHIDAECRQTIVQAVTKNMLSYDDISYFVLNNVKNEIDSEKVNHYAELMAEIALETRSLDFVKIALDQGCDEFLRKSLKKLSK